MIGGYQPTPPPWQHINEPINTPIGDNQPRYTPWQPPRPPMSVKPLQHPPSTMVYKPNPMQNKSQSTSSNSFKDNLIEKLCEVIQCVQMSSM